MVVLGLVRASTVPIAVAICLLAAGCSAQAGPLARSVGIASGAQPAEASPPGPSPSRRPDPCRKLRVALGRPISPVAGEEGFSLSFENVSQSGCLLKGYPEISLLGVDGRRLPFTWTDGHSPGPYFLSKRPAAILLVPGHAAHVLVAKYRCDLGDLELSRTASIRAAGIRGTVRLALPLDYCRGGRRSPGNTIGVTPYVSSISSVMP